MLKRPLGPPKTMITVDDAAEEARLTAELTMLESKLARVSRWSSRFLLAGLLLFAALPVLWYYVGGMFVLFEVPPLLVAFGGLGAMQWELSEIREQSVRLRRQRAEARARLGRGDAK